MWVTRPGGLLSACRVQGVCHDADQMGRGPWHGVTDDGGGGLVVGRCGSLLDILAMLPKCAQDGNDVRETHLGRGGGRGVNSFSRPLLICLERFALSRTVGGEKAGRDYLGRIFMVGRSTRARYAVARDPPLDGTPLLRSAKSRWSVQVVAGWKGRSPVGENRSPSHAIKNGRGRGKRQVPSPCGVSSGSSRPR